MANMTETTTMEPSDKEKLGWLIKNMDGFFLIVMGCIVFLMQCGFAFLEAGSVRSKNTVNILIKNMLDAFIGGVSYWAIGYALAYGDNGNKFCGASFFFSIGMGYERYPSWFFQFVFAATAATIVSGSVAERVQFFAYFVYSIIITAWVYPIVTHWAWDKTGWLTLMGYKDFAGSGVVHLLGATCALVACAFIGPRKGRFTNTGQPIDMPGHSVPLAALGGFILLFGFLAFNGGSQLSITAKGDAEIIGLAIVNTIIGGCGGGLCVLFTNKFLFGKKWSYLLTLNGALAGMVAQCAGCNVFQPWSALLIGVFGGFAFVGVHEAMLKMKLDDPLDAVAVHGGGGVVGILMVPFFEYENGILWSGSLDDPSAPWKQLGINIAGGLAIVVWSGFWCIVIFGILYATKLLRIDRDIEFQGMDAVKHGEPAYPAEAWVELQYAKKNSKAEGGNGPMMQGAGGAGASKGYNDPFEMMPATGGLFRQMSKNMPEGFSGPANTNDE